MENNNKQTLRCRLDYEKKPLYRGYTDKNLFIDLSRSLIKIKNIPIEVKEKFVGGKGYGLRFLWDSVNPNTRWNSEENEIVISIGPIGGITQYPGAGKSLVVSISPLTDIPIDSNVGGYFGPFLKFSGFDSLEIKGKAKKDVIICIDGNNGCVKIEETMLDCFDAHVLCEKITEMYAEDEKDKKNIAVITAGSASENTNIGILNFSFYDTRRRVARLKQAGRGGIGTVFRDKHIRAIVCKYSGVKSNLNNPANISLINKAGISFHKEMHDNDPKQNNMRKIGTANIIEVMDQYDLLPVHNYKFGSHKDTENIKSTVFINKYCTQGVPDGCWYGCSMSCAKAADNFLLKTGPYKGQRVTIDGPEYENAAGLGSNCGIFDPEAILELNFYCDTYGIDTISFGTLTAFTMECFENGILNLERTGGLDLHFGNKEAVFKLIHQMSKGEGFGKIAGMGIHKMKKLFIEKYDADKKFVEDIGMEQKGLEYSEYLCKESLAQQGGYGLTNKGPQHDEAWLIFMDMVHNQIPTFEDKAEALHYFPMFRTWFGLMGLCKLPWNDVTPSDNSKTLEPAKIPKHVQNYLDVYEGVTDIKMSRQEMIEQSERVYNFQRIFNIRMGKGLRKDDACPYRAIGPVTKEEYISREQRYDNQLKELGFNTNKMTLEEKILETRKHRFKQYEKLTDAVYLRRGWNNNGVPTLKKLEQLKMDLPELVDIIKRYS